MLVRAKHNHIHIHGSASCSLRLTQGGIFSLRGPCRAGTASIGPRQSGGNPSSAGGCRRASPGHTLTPPHQTGCGSCGARRVGRTTSSMRHRWVSGGAAPHPLHKPMSHCRALPGLSHRRKPTTDFGAFALDGRTDRARCRCRVTNDQQTVLRSLLSATGHHAHTLWHL